MSDYSRRVAAPIFAFVISAASSFCQPTKVVEVPDEVAYMFLFRVLRDAPPPHWDFQTKCNWMSKQGLSPDEVQILVNIANEFVSKTAAIEKKLTAHHDSFRGRLLDPAAQTAEALLRADLTVASRDAAKMAQGALSPVGLRKVQAKIGEIKKNVKHSPEYSPTQHKH